MCVGGGGAYILLGFAVLFKTKDTVFTMLKIFRIKHLKNLKYSFLTAK